MCNSHQASFLHQELGYCSEKFRVIPNGFDLDRFISNENLGLNVRKELAIPDDGIVLGHVGRFDAQKNHVGLIEAFRTIASENERIHLVCCGKDITVENKHIYPQLVESDLAHRVHLLGVRQDIPSVMNSFDIFVFPSLYGESFPNVVGEAMACEVPCLVTDVGDCAEIVGHTGWVVPTNDASALVCKLRQVLSITAKDYEHLGRLARQRVFEKYELKKVVRQYEELYLSLAD